MQSDRSDVPKHHQDRTWAIYSKSVPQLFLDRVTWIRGDESVQGLRDFPEVALHQAGRDGWVAEEVETGLPAWKSRWSGRNPAPISPRKLRPALDRLL